MNKTTKNNPAAFQKTYVLSLHNILKKTIKKMISGDACASIHFLVSELKNYYCQYKKNINFYCNLCNIESPYFLHTSNSKRILYNSICPNCSSRKRHRGLYEVYKNILLKYDVPRILHFAPEPVFYNLFNSYKYFTADLALLDVDLKLDIEKIDYPSNSFDIILCNHVLEHVKNDKKAITELYRILTDIGVAIITVPGNWKIQKTDEFDYPDRNGHYRDYGLNFLNLLSQIFHTVKHHDLYLYNNYYTNALGLTQYHDLVFICYKK